MPFQPGQSGNPKGAPKAEKRFKSALIRALKAAGSGDDAQALEKIATGLVLEATSGLNRLAAIKEIRDTLDGKPAQAIEHSGTMSLTHEERLSLLENPIDGSEGEDALPPVA